MEKLKNTKLKFQEKMFMSKKYNFSLNLNKYIEKPE